VTSECRDAHEEEPPPEHSVDHGGQSPVPGVERQGPIQREKSQEDSRQAREGERAEASPAPSHALGPSEPAGSSRSVPAGPPASLDHPRTRRISASISSSESVRSARLASPKTASHSFSSSGG